jgi:GTPase SAR1 family protein
MAGSGKTTLVQRLTAHFSALDTPHYLVNLDPAVMTATTVRARRREADQAAAEEAGVPRDEAAKAAAANNDEAGDDDPSADDGLPYAPNVDIRDTVDYRAVMREYSLGPNGGILTALNLFATRFDQVIRLLEKKDRAPPLRYAVFDTPGQIEIFTWSASGQIITELLASSAPTVVVYVADSARCAQPQAFMSNMLQAVSILYKSRLPLVLAFNKADVRPADYARLWMDDPDAYSEALERSDRSYAATLSRSLALVLDGFYEGCATVGVSAVTGQGIAELVAAIDDAAREYGRTYAVELAARKAVLRAREEARRAGEMERLRADMAAARVAGGAGGGRGGGGGGGGGAAGAGKGGGVAVAAGAGATKAAAVAAGEAAGQASRPGDEGESCDYEVPDESIEGSD